jgi:hypothetical protein
VKKRLSLLAALIMLLLPLCALADAQFDELCALLAEAASGPDQAYTLYQRGLDMIDQAGEGDANAALAALRDISAQLRALSPAPLAPSDALVAYMQARGLSLEDYQAVGKGAALSAGYYADSLDGMIATLAASPDQPAPSTALSRAGLDFERQMDFVALNTLLLPQNDDERDAVRRLVIEPTGYLAAAGLPWESDMELLFAKYDALEAAYGDMLANVSVTLDAQEAALDKAAP